jgi:hypothetical protein
MIPFGPALIRRGASIPFRAPGAAFTRSTAEFHFPHMSIVPVYTRIGAISWAGS